MGDVIHYDPKEWYTLKMLRGSVYFLEEKNQTNGQYSVALRQEKRQYGRSLEDYRAGKAITFH
jgi:hypothetical protein